MKYLKLFEDIKNEFTLPVDPFGEEDWEEEDNPDDDNLDIDISGNLKEFLNNNDSEISYQLLNMDIENGMPLDVVQGDNNIISFNNVRMKIGRAIKKILPHCRQSALEKFITQYRYYRIGKDDKKILNHFIAVNFKRWENGNTFFVSFPVRTKDYQLGYYDSNVDAETKQVCGRFSNEFARRNFDYNIVEYLQELGYEFRTEMVEGVEQNILYFDNEKDLYQLLIDTD